MPPINSLEIATTAYIHYLTLHDTFELTTHLGEGRPGQQRHVHWRPSAQSSAWRWLRLAGGQGCVHRAGAETAPAAAPPAPAAPAAPLPDSCTQSNTTSNVEALTT